MPRPSKGRRSPIIGYGSQGHAHAQNLRDSGVDVVVGLRRGLQEPRSSPRRPGSGSRRRGRRPKQADVVMILVPDTAQKAVYDAEIEPNLRPGAAPDVRPRLQHPVRADRPAGHGVDVGMVAPKGPGHLLRSVYVAGGGVPALFAVQQRRRPARPAARALAYARAIGATRAGVLETTFAEETETDLFGEQALLCGGVSALVKAAFETLVEAGYQPELAYFETMHELKLIVDLMYRGGLNFMRFSVSDTAEFGDYVSGPRVAEGVKATMKDVLADIQGGLVREPLDRRAGGRRRRVPASSARRDRDHQIEQVGAELRAKMPFLNPVVVHAGEAQAGQPGGTAPARVRVEGGGLMAPATTHSASRGPARPAGPGPRLRHDPPRRRAGAGRGPHRGREAGGRAAARPAQGRRHRGGLPGRHRRRLRGGPADRPGDEGRHRGRGARALPRRRPAAGGRGDQGRRAAAPPRLHRDQRHPPQAQAPHRPRRGAAPRRSVGPLRPRAAGP